MIMHRSLLASTLLSLSVAAPMFFAAPSPASAQEPRMLVLPVRLDATAQAQAPAGLDDLVFKAFAGTPGYAVLGKAELNATAAADRAPVLLNCSQMDCFVEAGGTMQAAWIAEWHLAVVNGQFFITAGLISPGNQSVAGRSGAAVGAAGEINGALRGIVVDLFKQAAAPGTPVPHQCRYGVLDDCTTQCNGGHPGSCEVLAEMYRTGTGTTVDEAQAATLRQKACDSGRSSACGGGGDTAMPTTTAPSGGDTGASGSGQLSPREIAAACNACQDRCAPYRNECNSGKYVSCFRSGACMCQCKLTAGGCGSTVADLQKCIGANEAKMNGGE